jgi:hypothetical protein
VRNQKRIIGNFESAYNDVMNEDDDMMNGDDLVDKRVGRLLGSRKPVRTAHDFEQDLLRKDDRAKGWEMNNRISAGQKSRSVSVTRKLDWWAKEIDARKMKRVQRGTMEV